MFIGIFSYGTWVLTGVVEEKQSRVVEVVLSTVRPRDLLMGKVLGIGLLALAQLVVLVAAGIAAAQISGRLTLPPTTVGAVVQLLVWFILGFAFYSTAMGFLGALASRDGGGLERVDAGDDDRDGLLPRVDPRRHAGPAGVLARRHDVPAAGRADGRPAAGRARARSSRGRSSLSSRSCSPRSGCCSSSGRGSTPAPCSRPAAGSGSATPGAPAADQPAAGPGHSGRAWTSAQRKQAVSWSFTRPADCISA